jgi:hypothetical protein
MPQPKLQEQCQVVRTEGLTSESQEQILQPASSATGPKLYPLAPYPGGERYGSEGVDKSRSRAEEVDQNAPEIRHSLEYGFTPTDPPLVSTCPFMFPAIAPSSLSLSLRLFLYRYPVRSSCITNVFSSSSAHISLTHHPYSHRTHTHLHLYRLGLKFT